MGKAQSTKKQSKKNLSVEKEEVKTASDNAEVVAAKKSAAKKSAAKKSAAKKTEAKSVKKSAAKTDTKKTEAKAEVKKAGKKSEEKKSASKEPAKKNKKKTILLTAMSIFLATVMILSGLGIYFKLTHKEKHAEVNPLDFSYDTWDGTIEAVDFNEEYAGRGVLTKTINSAAAFAHFISEVNSGNSFENYTVYLNSNIDLGGREISSIGNSANPFKGTFDGGHYTILNAKINGNGLFENTENATIKNVGLYNATFTNETQNNKALINKAINTNVENCFVRLGNANLVNEYISNNGEHYIKNSFVDSEANGLVGSIDTNNSSENKVTISNSYFTKGEVSVLNKVGTADVEEKEVIKATNKSDFADWNYSAEYKTDKEWCDYNYLANSQKLDFVYPLQAGFVKVYLTGSCYESVVTSKNGNVSVDTTNLAEAFVEADKQEEAQVNLLVEKIFMEAKAEVANTNVTINAVKDTTIVRGENNTDAMFVGNGTSKITLGTAPSVGTASGSNATTATLTLDGNRKYFEKNNLDSGALVVANGGEVEIHENVVIKNNINNTTGYGGAVIVANAQEEVKIGATFENCSSTAGGGAVTIITEQETLTLSKSAEYINCSSASGGALYIANTLPEETVEEMRKLYGRNINIKPTEDYVERQTTLTELTGTNTFKGCSATYDGVTATTGYGGAIYCETDFSISGTATFGGTGENEGNSAIGGTYGYGGAIYCKGTLTINEDAEATFIGNSATGTNSGQGGAIYVNGNMTISGNVSFTNNASKSDGGAIYEGNNNCTVLITETAEVEFKGNTATRGAAISTSGVVEIAGNAKFGGEEEIDGNIASATAYGMSGGAINCGSVIITETAEVEFLNNKIEGLYTSAGAISGNVKIDGKAIFNNNKSSGTKDSFGGGAIKGSAIEINGIVSFNGNTSEGVAGAIYGSIIINEGATATFANNSSKINGGAIYGALTVNQGTNVSFKGNTSVNGGALYSKSSDISIAGKVVFGGENDGDENIASGTTYGGGAIYAGDKTLTLTDTSEVEFTGNTAQKGGAVYVKHLIINNGSRFVNNTAKDVGGAVYVSGSLSVNAKTSFENNSSTKDGGAVYAYDVYHSGNTPITLNADVEFIKNSALNGGALYSCNSEIILSEDSNVTFTENSSSGNKQNSGGSGVHDGGGAIKIHYRQSVSTANKKFLTISGKATFYGNSSQCNGGAISANVIMETRSDCTFQNNTSAAYGGAIYGTTTIHNASFTSNTAANIGGAIHGSTTITGETTFTGNTGLSSGAIYGTTTINEGAEATFIENSATTGSGGAINGKTIIDGSAIFTSNISPSSGGAIYGTTIITGETTFTGNIGSSGGAIYGSTTINESANVTFAENYTTTGAGGAISSTSSDSFVYIYGYVLFQQNKATTSGGAIGASNVAIYEKATTIFSKNESKTDGGAICCGSKGEIIISGTATFSENSANRHGAIYAYQGGTNWMKGLLDGDITLYNNMASSTYPDYQSEIFMDNYFMLGADINVLSTTGLPTLRIGQAYDGKYSPAIKLTTQLSKPITVYKYKAAAYNNDNYQSYIFEDCTEDGLKNVGGSYPFKVVNAPAGTAVDFNNLKPKFGVLAAGTTVTLDLDGGESAENSVVVFENTPYGSLPTPTKEGYEFLGWFTSGGTKVNSTTKVFTSGEHTLYAKYASTSYTTTYGNDVAISYVSSSAGTYTITSSNPSVATVLYSAKVLANSEYSAVVETRGVGEATITMSFVPNDPSVQAPADKTYTVTINPTTLYTPSNLAWETNSNGGSSVASWDEVVCKGVEISYQVELLKGEEVVATVTTENSSYDFSSLMKESAGAYAFNVTALSANATLASSSAKSDNSDIVTSTTYTFAKDEGISTILINGVECYEYVNVPGEIISITCIASEGFVFDGWTFDGETAPFANASNQSTTITSGSGEITANAKVKPIYVSLLVSNPNFGSIMLDGEEVTKVEGKYNDSVSVDENNNLIIGEITLIPTPKESTVANHYTFDGWSGILDPLTRDVLFVANFSEHINKYTITISSNDTQMGTIVPNEPIVADYGTPITFNKNIITIGDETKEVIEAKPNDPTNQYVFSFDNWEGTVHSTLDGNVSIIANFSKEYNSHNITFVADPDGYGSVAISNSEGDVEGSTINVKWGTEIILNENDTLTIGDYTITPIPQDQSAEFTYSFLEWSDHEGTVDGPRTITANFERTTRSYKVTFVVDPEGYGFVNGLATTDVTVLYGTEFLITDETLSLLNNEIVATPAVLDDGYEYSFASWSVSNGEKVQGEMTVTATFTREAKDYTITYLGLEGAEVDNPKTYTVEDTFTLINPEHDTYSFQGWKETGVDGIRGTVTIEVGTTGNKEFTAIWNVTVNIEASGNEENNKFSVTVVENNTDIGTYSTAFTVTLHNTYTFKVYANLLEDEDTNEYQILRVKVNNLTEVSAYSPSVSSIDDTTAFSGSIDGVMTIKFEYLSAYMMVVNIPENSITSLTVNLIEDEIFSYSSKNAYIIADGTPVLFTVNSVPAGAIEKHSFIGFEFTVGSTVSNVGTEGGGGIQFLNFTHNPSYTSDRDVGEYNYRISPDVQISELNVETVVTLVVDIDPSALPDGVIITIESEHGLNKVIEADTKSVLLYAGEWTVTAGNVTLSDLQGVFPNATIKEVDGKFVIVIS